MRNDSNYRRMGFTGRSTVHDRGSGLSEPLQFALFKPLILFTHWTVVTCNKVGRI